MSRPRGTNTVKETVYFSTDAFAAIKKFRARYPMRSVSDITSAAVLYLAKQAIDFQLDGALEPMTVDVKSLETRLETRLEARLETRMHEIAAEEAAVYHTKEGTDKKKPPNKKETRAS